MLKIATLPIEATDTSASMYEKLAELGPEALIDCLADIAAGKAVPVKQDDELANYAKKLSKEEARINWNDDAAHIERCVRAQRKIRWWASLGSPAIARFFKKPKTPHYMAKGGHGAQNGTDECQTPTET